MSNQVFLSNQVFRAFTVVVTAAVLVVSAGAASAHGMGMNMGMNHSIGNGPQTVNFTQLKTTNLSPKLVDHDRRRFRFISVGTYAAPATTCFYKHTVWGWAKICPDLDVD